MIRQQYNIYDHVTSELINSMLYVKLLTQHVGEGKSPSAGVYKRGGRESTYPLEVNSTCVSGEFWKQESGKIIRLCRNTAME